MHLGKSVMESKIKTTCSLIMTVAGILLQSCEYYHTKQHSFVSIDDDSTELIQIEEVTDSSIIGITDIAEKVMYFRQNRRDEKKNISQVYYDENQIIVYDLDSLFFYSLDGNEKKRISFPMACVDYDIANHCIYIYEFKKRKISVLTSEGALTNTISVKSVEAGYYGNYFASINDFLYVIASPNTTGDNGGLLFISCTGNIVGRKKTQEVFQPSQSSYSYNMVWDIPVFRTPIGIGYYPWYEDVVYWLNENGETEPFFTEKVLKKVPVNHRTEVTGGELDEYIKQCKTNMWSTPRYYINKRFILAQYVYGRSTTDLPGYLLYDKKNGKSRVHKDLFSFSIMHYGLYNDYDGGIAFTPMNQCGDYLMMAGAGMAQGGMSGFPKTLYNEGRKFGENTVPVVSNVSKDKRKSKVLSDFFLNFDEDKQTMITALKLKQ